MAEPAEENFSGLLIGNAVSRISSKDNNNITNPNRNLNNKNGPTDNRINRMNSSFTNIVSNNLNNN